MNYHLIIPDKFFAIYIDDIYAIHEEANNVIWVRGNEGDNPVFCTNHPVEYIGNDPNVYQDKFKILNSEDKLIVSWYNIDISYAFQNIDIPCPIYIYLLGGEFYGEPMWYHESWLLDPMTKKIYYKTFNYPGLLRWHRPWRWYRYLEDYKRYMIFKRNMIKEYNLKNDTLAKVDYVVITKHSDPEIEFCKKLYPKFRAKHVNGMFDQNFEIAAQQKMKPVPHDNERLKILFGNSADPTGNHVDALHYIKNHINDSVEIYSFLSYGNQYSREWTIKYGINEFGNKFHPITEYMDRQDFTECVNSMDILMMYHNRQQAEGNIMTALVLGKPVFIKPENPQFEMLRRMGVKPVYDVHKMHDIDLRAAIRFAQSERINTIRCIQDEYSRENRLKYLKDMLNFKS